VALAPQGAAPARESAAAPAASSGARLDVQSASLCLLTACGFFAGDDHSSTDEESGDEEGAGDDQGQENKSASKSSACCVPNAIFAPLSMY
jgi:hypothetical protein